MTKYPKSIDFSVCLGQENIHFQKNIHCKNFKNLDGGFTNFDILDTEENINTINFLNMILEINEKEGYNKYNLTMSYKTSIFKKVTGELKGININKGGVIC